jgi:NAD(P)-dependent dehydrogenase (short-subunit alcohol dehydrogenase family)
MKHELPVMLGAGRGVIVNNSSVTGLVGSPGMSVYVASKHAILGLTKTAALEYASTGIRINVVCPGGVETEMTQRLTQATSNAEAFVALHPIGRVGKPEEIASAVLYLCSPGAAFATGAAFVLDGGWSAQ